MQCCLELMSRQWPCLHGLTHGACLLPTPAPPPCQVAVMEVRDKEAGILRRIIWWQALFIMLLFSGPVIMAVAVFAV